MLTCFSVICSPSFPSVVCVPYLKSCYTEIIAASFSLHSLCTERSWNVLKLSTAEQKVMATIYLATPPPLCSSEAMLIQSTAVAALLFRESGGQSRWVGGESKKRGGRGERERRLTVCQQTQLGEKRGCPLTAPSNRGKRGKEGCRDKWYGGGIQ